MKACLLICIICIPLLFSSCNNDKKEAAKNKKLVHKPLHNSASKPSDTLLIDYRAAVSVFLDSTALEKRRKKYGDEAFTTGADDAVNYAAIADSLFKAKRLIELDADNYKYLKFIQNNGETILIRTDTLSQIFSLYFFDPSKAPHNTDVTTIEDEYNKFYH